MATSNARQSIPEDPEPQGTRRNRTHTRRVSVHSDTGVRMRRARRSSSPMSRRPRYRVGVFIANKARFAKPSDIYAGTWHRGRSSPSGHKPRLQPSLGCSERQVCSAAFGRCVSRE